MESNSRHEDRPEPELPARLSVDDLQYHHPQKYPLDMASKGWSVQLEHNVDDNPAKVRYHLSRDVGESFTKEELFKLSLRTRLGDADDFLPGYSLELDGSKLVFDFEGFPTKETMDVMNALESEFKRKSWIRRKLGRLSRGGKD